MMQEDHSERERERRRLRNERVTRRLAKGDRPADIARDEGISRPLVQAIKKNPKLGTLPRRPRRKGRSSWVGRRMDPAPGALELECVGGPHDGSHIEMYPGEWGFELSDGAYVRCRPVDAPGSHRADPLQAICRDVLVWRGAA